ncbi:hypothetical protein FQZ97_1130570 [compost metagenome]
MEVKGHQPRRQIDGDAGVVRQKLRQPGREPAGAKGRKDGQVQRAAPGVGPKGQSGGGHAPQRGPDFLGVGLARHGQADHLALPGEQLGAELFLQRPDLPADRALREVELAGGRREAAQPGGRLKGSEHAHRWQEPWGELGLGHCRRSFQNRMMSVGIIV